MPRQPYPNFYYDQEDVVFDRAQKKGFTWSVARPHTMIGFAPNNLVVDSFFIIIKLFLNALRLWEVMFTRQEN